MIMLFKKICDKAHWAHLSFLVFFYKNTAIILFFIEIVSKIFINLFYFFYYRTTLEYFEPLWLYNTIPLDFFDLKSSKDTIDLCMMMEMEEDHDMAESGRVAAPTQLPPAPTQLPPAPEAPPANIGIKRRRADSEDDVSIHYSNPGTGCSSMSRNGAKWPRDLGEFDVSGSVSFKSSGAVAPSDQDDGEFSMPQYYAGAGGPSHERGDASARAGADDRSGSSSSGLYEPQLGQGDPRPPRDPNRSTFPAIPFDSVSASKPK